MVFNDPVGAVGKDVCVCEGGGAVLYIHVHVYIHVFGSVPTDNRLVYLLSTEYVLVLGPREGSQYQ